MLEKLQCKGHTTETKNTYFARHFFLPEYLTTFIGDLNNEATHWGSGRTQVGKTFDWHLSLEEIGTGLTGHTKVQFYTEKEVISGTHKYA